MTESLLQIALGVAVYTLVDFLNLSIEALDAHDLKARVGVLEVRLNQNNENNINVNILPVNKDMAACRVTLPDRREVMNSLGHGCSSVGEMPYHYIVL